MEQRSSIRRRFTLGDITVLVACTGVGFWLCRSYFQNENIVFRNFGVARTWWSWAQLGLLALMPIQLGLLGLSLAPPRRRLRSLARQPGFLAGVAIASGLASSALQFAANYKLLTARGTSPGEAWLQNNMIAVSASYRLAPAILLAWMIVGLQGGCRRSPDWVETSSRLLAGVSIVAWCTYMIIRFLT